MIPYDNPKFDAAHNNRASYYKTLILGETVEENANLVVRLLIRRPECLGPALRGGSKVMKHSTGNTGTDGLEVPPGGPDGLHAASESTGQLISDTDYQPNLAGGGLLKAMKEGLVMSAQIKLVKMAQEAEAAGLNPEEEDLGWRTVLMDYEDANLFTPLPYNFESLPVSKSFTIIFHVSDLIDEYPIHIIYKCV